MSDARLGATFERERGTVFRVWAPAAEAVEVVLEDGARIEPLALLAHGVHGGTLTDVLPGAHYRFRLHRRDREPVDRPDPASRWQPEGVHGPSAIDGLEFPWTDHEFRALPMHRQVLYELHVGTFSTAGTFEGVIEHLGELVRLGVTTLELMPVWQFPGARNWGYDGVLPSAVQDSYGGPEGLRRLVDEAHAHGLAVFLDVVYNHLGPEGNYLSDFGPYTLEGRETPWGAGLNWDGPGADGLRRWVIENAVGWVRDFHIDGLRLDAVHGIFDTSAVHVLEELTRAVHNEGERLGKPVFVIAESDLCDPRLVRATEVGGYGLDAQWSDEFHHALHVALTGEDDGYYEDYTGLDDIARQLRDRFAFAGRWSPHRGRTLGRAARELPYDKFVVCTQNHDQVGNRMLGERSSVLFGFEGQKLAAAAMLTSPFVPLLFMGEEHGEVAPFQYFVSHGDEVLVEAVRRGRRAEFAAFRDRGEPPDPGDPSTFARSQVDHGQKHAAGEHGALYALYRHLIELRRERPLLTDPDAPDVIARRLPGRQTLVLERFTEHRAHITVIHAEEESLAVEIDARGFVWTRALDTADEEWAGPGAGSGPFLRADGVIELELAPQSVVLLDGRLPG